MYLGPGATLEGKLGEAISLANVDVQTVAIDLSNNISVKTGQQLDGTSAKTVVDASKGFVDEVIVNNTDNVPHYVTVQINTGSEVRGLMTTWLSQGASLVYKPRTGWQVLGSFVGSGWVSSGMLAAGVVLSGAMGSGQVDGNAIASGSIGPTDFGNKSVISGSIASGQVSDPHFASGAKADCAEFLVADGIITAEMISGVKAVTVTTSGTLVMAMAGQSGRFPAIGVVVDNVASGQPARRYHKGRARMAGITPSGGIGADDPIWLGASGQLTATPYSLGSGLAQVMGFGEDANTMLVEMTYVGSGMITRYALASGAVNSGHFGSGQVWAPIQFLSGAIIGDHINDASVSMFKIAQNTVVAYAQQNIDDNALMITEEMISGVKAVNISQSGRARVAMAGVSGRMPAAGVLLENVASGGVLTYLSGNAPLIVRGYITEVMPASGFGQWLYVGMSGDLVCRDGVNVSGVVIQRIGVNATSGIMVMTDMSVTSGFEPPGYY